MQSNSKSIYMKKTIFTTITALLLITTAQAQNYQDGPRGELAGKILYCRQVIANDEVAIHNYQHSIKQVCRHRHLHWKNQPYTDKELSKMGAEKITVLTLQDKIRQRNEEETRMMALISDYNNQLKQVAKK